MTDKERLKEIKEIYRWAIENSIANRIADSDIEWLIQQAERVEKLELEVNDWRAEVQKWQKFYEESEESHSETKELLYSTISEIKRYKQALEFYADPMIWREGNRIKGNTFEMPLANNDNGHKARKALEGKE